MKMKMRRIHFEQFLGSQYEIKIFQWNINNGSNYGNKVVLYYFRCDVFINVFLIRVVLQTISPKCSVYSDIYALNFFIVFPCNFGIMHNSTFVTDDKYKLDNSFRLELWIKHFWTWFSTVELGLHKLTQNKIPFQVEMLHVRITTVRIIYIDSIVEFGPLFNFFF